MCSEALSSVLQGVKLCLKGTSRVAGISGGSGDFRVLALPTPGDIQGEL